MSDTLYEVENYKLQFASDLHLEEDAPPFDILIKPVARDLALCGDIGDPWSPVYTNFLKWCSLRWEHVFLLSGNHEYFTKGPETWSGADKTYGGVEAQIHRVAEAAAEARKNIHFLQESVYPIEKQRILIVGTTLWTAPALRRWDQMSAGFVGDPGCRGEYNSIYRRDEYTGALRVFHPSDITAIYNRQAAFLKRFLNTSWGSVPEGWRVIVLTHHLPSLEMNRPDYRGHPLVSCYATSLDELLKEPVVAWLCGHSHTAMEKQLDTGTLVCLNPMGYKREAGRTGYSRVATITVYPENMAIFRKDYT